MEILGHDGPPSPQLWTKNLLTDADLDRCPLRTLQLAPPDLDTELHRYTESHVPAYDAGHLLLRGGWAEQPARYTALVQLIVRTRKQVQAKYDELTMTDEE